MTIASFSTPTRLAVDYRHRRAEVELASGLVLASPLSDRAARHDGEIARTDYEPASRELRITFRWGESATIEIGPVDPPPAPAVYLDQNHWIMLARQQWSPSKVPEPHRKAYARLASLSRERAILLPLSGAHAVETARKDGRQRRDLATTMLQLSRGWQMRSPIKVRREELVSALVGFRSDVPPFRPRPVFTLDPDALFSATDYAGAASAERDLHARLTWASAIAEVLIEDEREDDEIARASVERWATTYAALGTDLKEAKASREDKRASARAALLADFTDDLALAAATVGLDRGELDAWLQDCEESIAAMPSNGRVQELTHRRLSNSQHPWRHGNLNDMHFLACAAGYADFLLAENETSDDLRLAESRAPAGARICRSPGELVALVEAQL
jgi:hypothetical protein